MQTLKFSLPQCTLNFASMKMSIKSHNNLLKTKLDLDCTEYTRHQLWAYNNESDYTGAKFCYQMPFSFISLSELSSRL